MFFGFACEQRYAEIARLDEFRRERLQHRDAAADVEAADRDRDAFGPESPRDRHRARKLVGLNADQADDAAVSRLLDSRGDSFDRYLDVHLVVSVDLDRHILAEHALFRAIACDRMQASHRIGGDPRLPPLDDVAVPIVMRRLDDLDVKRLQESPRSTLFCRTLSFSALRANQANSADRAARRNLGTRRGGSEPGSISGNQKPTCRAFNSGPGIATDRVKPPWSSYRAGSGARPEFSRPR